MVTAPCARSRSVCQRAVASTLFRGLSLPPPTRPHIHTRQTPQDSSPPARSRTAPPDRHQSPPRRSRFSFLPSPSTPRALPRTLHRPGGGGGGGHEAPGPPGPHNPPLLLRLLPPRVRVGAAGGGGPGGHRGAGAAGVPVRGAGGRHPQLQREAEAGPGRVRPRLPRPPRRRPGGGRQAARRRVQARGARVPERGHAPLTRPAPQRRQPAGILRPRRRREAARLRVRPQREPRQDPLLRRPAAAAHQQITLQQQRERPEPARGAHLAAAARGGGGRGARAAVPARGRAHAHHPPRHQGKQHPPRPPVGRQDRRLRHGSPLPGGRRRPHPRADPRGRHQRVHGPRVPHARPPLRQGRRLQLRRPRPRDRLRPQELQLRPASRLRRREPPRLRLEAVQEGAEHGAAGPVREVVGGAGQGAAVRPHRAAVRAGRPAAAAGHEARGDHPLQEAEHAGGADAARGAWVEVPAEGPRPAQLSVLGRVIVRYDPLHVRHVSRIDVELVGFGFERDDGDGYVQRADLAEPGAPLAPAREGVAEQRLKLHCIYGPFFFSFLVRFTVCLMVVE